MQRERGGAEIQAIGAGALNQAIKAGQLPEGLSPLAVWIDLHTCFLDIVIDGEERTIKTKATAVTNKNTL